ncbi:N-acyl-L-amino-acid amidohydrolase [Ancylostoma duodenale]|uniref:N-acyl-L-amino-acid amidohydrolase n=1 Tax=Ancylostoma duodenale TaxID=51022 RepID=A0A0C2DG98_9BILA|nr:N-acyl-L-amino-acid amidohydrolase [Ancylostoma duodenale]
MASRPSAKSRSIDSHAEISAIRIKSRKGEKQFKNSLKKTSDKIRQRISIPVVDRSAETPQFARLVVNCVAEIGQNQPNRLYDNWKYDPYSGYKDEHGNIYGRGAQDMKSVGSQYFEAIRRHFKRGKKQWLRTIHIVWAPDEEIGAVDGMAKFVKMPEFRELNLGFMLDEGLATEGIEITCEGSPGHGSKFIENTAGEKLQSIINSALTFREEQRSLLKKDPSKKLGDVITLNLTKVEGGVQVNVLPEKFTICESIALPEIQ